MKIHVLIAIAIVVIVTPKGAVSAHGRPRVQFPIPAAAGTAQRETIRIKHGLFGDRFRWHRGNGFTQQGVAALGTIMTGLPGVLAGLSPLLGTGESAEAESAAESAADEILGDLEGRSSLSPKLDSIEGRLNRTFDFLELPAYSTYSQGGTGMADSGTEDPGSTSDGGDELSGSGV